VSSSCLSFIQSYRSDSLIVHGLVLTACQANETLECPLCYDLDARLRAPPDEVEDIHLGVVKELLTEAPCRAQAAFLRWIFKETRKIRRAPDLDNHSNLSAELILLQDAAGFNNMRSSDNEMQYRWPTEFVAVVQQPRNPMDFAHARILNRSWIDVDLVKHWLSQCNAAHGTQCRRPRAAQRLPRIDVSWLIDVHQGCLTRALPGNNYVALSYVWGRGEFLTTTMANLEKYQQPKIFSSGTIANRMPRTIKDAMGLIFFTRFEVSVGRRSLYRLDDATRHDCIQHMASVYATANFTIVAAAGNSAAAGLPGLPGSSQARGLTQDIFDWQGLQVRKECLSKWSWLQSSAWLARGWTFQEYLFSPRRLVFNSGSVRWDCPSMSWIEELECDLEPEGIIGGFINDSFEHPFYTSMPEIRNLGLLVEAYSRRQLTFQEDSVDTFAGTLTALTYNYQGGFIHGLPIMFLDVALLWQPETEIASRTSFTTNWDCPPTWSWIRWKGEIQATVGWAVMTFCLERGSELLETAVWHLWYNGLLISPKIHRRLRYLI